MSFAISRAVCYNNEIQDSTESKISFSLADASLVIIASIASVVFLTHALTSIPIGVGNWLGYGSIAFGGTIILADITAGIVTAVIKHRAKTKWISGTGQLSEQSPNQTIGEHRTLHEKAGVKTEEPKVEPPKVLDAYEQKEARLLLEARELLRKIPTKQSTDEIQSEISNAQEKLKLTQDDESYKRAKKINTVVNHIANGLYLGRMEGLKSCAEFFDSIVTVTIPGPHDGSVEDISKNLKSREKEWFYVGRMVVDNYDCWPTLVHDCTFDSKKIQEVEGEQGLTCEFLNQPEGKKKYIEINARKKEALDKIPVKDWFKPIYDLLDQATNDGKRVLVHCSGGVSRSPTLIAAYLIGRLGATTDQALAFLSLKRPGIYPHSSFVKGLKEYELKLYPERAKTS